MGVLVCMGTFGFVLGAAGGGAVVLLTFSRPNLRHQSYTQKWGYHRLGSKGRRRWDLMGCPQTGMMLWAKTGFPALFFS